MQNPLSTALHATIHAASSGPLAGQTLVPSASIAAEARQGLVWRAIHSRGGNALFAAYARDLSARRSLNDSTLHALAAHHQLLRADGPGWNPTEAGFPSADRITSALLG